MLAEGFSEAPGHNCALCPRPKKVRQINRTLRGRNWTWLAGYAS